MPDNVFELKHISFSYDKGNEILHDINLTFPRGEITALIGPNGCGKTTLFCLLSKVKKKYLGQILFEDTDINEYKIRDYAKKVAVVHQYNVVPDDMTVKALVSMGRTPFHSAIFASETNDDKLAVEEAMEITRITEFADKQVKELSGGQMQRVWLALSLAQSKNILLLDEITTYLDVHYQYETLNLIKELNKKYGTTVLMVLHDINQTIEFSDNVILMKDGKIIESGTPEKVITEENICKAYGIQSDIIDYKNKKYCIFKKEKI